MQPAGYNDSIFINCPFDTQYTPILRAMIFAVYRCGFLPQTALSEDNALDNRLDKIERSIANCRYGIHDISRTEFNEHDLPRYNMPFELGIFFGAKYFGNKQQKNKNALIFDVERYRYLEYISDLNGVDIKAHGNDPFTAIREIRDWLKTTSGRTTIPGYKLLIKEYQEFLKKLPTITHDLGLNIDDIPFNDYCLIVEETLKETL